MSTDAPQMSNTSKPASASKAMFGILAAQLGVSFLLAVIGGFAAGKTAAYSGLIGGMICVLPNTFLALRILVAGFKREPQALVSGLYVAEAGKMMLSVMLFIVAFTLVKPLAAGWLFAGFIATQSVMWVALRLDKTGFEASGHDV
ncbi:MAG: ATP synthase subunit I [Gammaproteobacteria bacterium]|nr:ATP synthase subunit I [Gammaproteobacteria bacterium]